MTRIRGPVLRVVPRVLVLFGLFSCGRDRQVRPLPEAPVEDNQVSLHSRPLGTHEDFDQIEKWVLGRGSGEDLLRFYDDLARLAPGHARVLVRGALAALAVDPDRRGPTIADGVIEALRDRIPTDPDLAWLVLRRKRLLFGDAGRPIPADPSREAEMADLARRAQDFARDFPDWRGPHGATAQDALRMAREVEAATTGGRP